MLEQSNVYKINCLLLILPKNVPNYKIRVWYGIGNCQKVKIVVRSIAVYVYYDKGIQNVTYE